MSESVSWWKYKYAAAGNAWQIASTLSASVPLADIGDRMKPAQIAKFACDVAAAMAQEMEARDWLEFCDRDEKTP